VPAGAGPASAARLVISVVRQVRSRLELSEFDVLHGTVMALRRATPPHPLLPGRWRPLAIATVFVDITGITILAAAYRSQEHAGRLDGLIAAKLAGDTIFNGAIASDVTMLGSPWAVTVISGLLVFLAARTRSGWRAVVLAAAGPTIASLLCELALKPLVDRRLRGDLAFPSGHATGLAAVAAAAVVIVVAGQVGGRLGRAATALLVGGAVAALGTSLVALDQHYATDVVGGFLVATATVSGLALAHDRCPTRRAAAAPAAVPRPDRDQAGAP
jgi:undecaprenyl-diphosphatase